MFLFHSQPKTEFGKKLYDYTSSKVNWFLLLTFFRALIKIILYLLWLI